jgi:hypothetical protein
MRRSALACAWPCRRSAGDRRAGGGLGSRGGVDSRSRWRRISARVSRWSMGCVRAGCRWGRRRLWVWMRRRGRACTTWRCSASWAVRRMPRRPLPGGRRRGDVQRRHGTDVDGSAGRERALLPAPCGGGSSRAPPSWPCGPSDGRPPDGSAQLVGTLRGSGPPGRPAQHGRCRPGGAGPCLRALGRKGYPDGLAGEDVPLAIRVISVARDAELWARQAPTYQRLHGPPVTLGRLLSTLLA